MKNAADEFQQVQQNMDRLDAIAAVKEGLRDVAHGRTRPMREALLDIARKHNLPLAKGE
jgi:predicted transcriptional regulator